MWRREFCSLWMLPTFLFFLLFSDSILWKKIGDNHKLRYVNKDLRSPSWHLKSWSPAHLQNGVLGFAVQVSKHMSPTLPIVLNIVPPYRRRRLAFDRYVNTKHGDITPSKKRISRNSETSSGETFSFSYFSRLNSPDRCQSYPVLWFCFLETFSDKW